MTTLASKEQDGDIAGKEKAARRLVVKSAVRVVPLDAIQADAAYQRDVKKGHKAIVSDFKDEAFGIPLVGEREDGTLWIVDGLQRITALRKLGRKDVRAEVFASKGTEHEAAIFKTVNMGRTKLNSAEQFRARLAAHDELAWEIKEAVEACGYRIVLGKSGGKESGAEQLTCVSTLVAIASRHGTQGIKFALNCIKQSWPGDRLGVHSGMVAGLSAFFADKGGVVDMERLLPRLRSVTAQKVLYAASQATLTNNLTNSVGQVIANLYAKRMVKK